MDKKKYTVTEKAGHWVAGKRSPGKGKTIELSEEEARYALIAGELEDPSKADSGETATAGRRSSGAPSAGKAQSTDQAERKK